MNSEERILIGLTVELSVVYQLILSVSAFRLCVLIFVELYERYPKIIEIFYSRYKLFEIV